MLVVCLFVGLLIEGVLGGWWVGVVLFCFDNLRVVGLFGFVVCWFGCLYDDISFSVLLGVWVGGLVFIVLGLVVGFGCWLLLVIFVFSWAVV